MNPSHDELVERYEGLSTDELLFIYKEGELTELAKPIFLRELNKRRINVDSIDFEKIKTPLEIDRKERKKQNRCAR